MCVCRCIRVHVLCWVELYVGPAAAPRRGSGLRLDSVVPVAPGRAHPGYGQGMVYWTDWPHRSKPGVSWPVLRRRGRCRCRVSCCNFAMCKKPVPHVGLMSVWRGERRGLGWPPPRHTVDRRPARQRWQVRDTRRRLQIAATRGSSASVRRDFWKPPILNAANAFVGDLAPAFMNQA